MPHSNSSSATSGPQKAALYAASCNPPRKAKRQRVDTDTTTLDADPPSGMNQNGNSTTGSTFTSTVSRSPTVPNVRIRPAPPVPNTSTAPGHSSGPMPTPVPMQPTPSADSSTTSALPPPGPKKRGRKPGAMSRSARETQRKINHSRIEKARRSKINDALDSLRSLVPSDFGKDRLIPEDESEQPSKGGKKEEKEREFKLDILERTVFFVEHLIAKVASLEEGKPQCNCQVTTGPSTSESHPYNSNQGGSKRKRALDHDGDDALSVEDELSGLSGDEDDELSEAPSVHEPPPPPTTNTQRGSQRGNDRAASVSHRAPSTDSVRLPSIMNLLNHAPPPPREVRSPSRSTQGSPYGPFGPHIFSSTSSPSPMHPAVLYSTATIPGRMPGSRRASTTSSSSVFSPSLHAYTYHEATARHTQPYVHSQAQESTMSPLALGLLSPPASGNITNPYSHNHRADPPTLKLPSPRRSPVEMREVGTARVHISTHHGHRGNGHPEPGAAHSARQYDRELHANSNDNTTSEDARASAPRWQPTSPVWTREDESAASLLLQIGSSASASSRSDSKSVSPPTAASVSGERKGREDLDNGGSAEIEKRWSGRAETGPGCPGAVSNMEAQTPGRLLGIRTKLSE